MLGKPTILGNPHIDMKKSADMFFITPTAPERLFARPTTDLILVRVDVHLICRFQFSLQCNMWQPLIALMKLHLPIRLVGSLSYVSIFSCFVLISSRSFLFPSSRCCLYAKPGRDGDAARASGLDLFAFTPLAIRCCLEGF